MPENEKSRTDTHLLSKMFRGILITNAISIVAGIACVMIDGIVTGQFLGPDAVTAAGLLQPIVMLINLIGGLLGGAGVMCAAYMGKAQRDRVNQVFSIVLIAALIYAALSTVLVFVLAPWLGEALGAKTGSPEIVAMIRDYLRGFCPGIPFMRVTILLTSIMMLDNDKKRGMAATGATLLADTVFDLANVLIFHGGMFGMAIATSLSNFVGFAVIMTHYRMKNRVIHFTAKGLRMRDLGDVAMRGIPNAINMGCQALRMFCFNTLLLAIADKTAVAGLSIANSAFSIIFAIVLGMFMSASMISSLMYNEEDRRGLEYSITLAIRITGAIFVVLGAVIALIPRPVALLFVNKSAIDTVDQGAAFIRFWAIQFLFTAVSFPISGTYQGTGRLRESYVIDIMREGVLPILSVTGLGKAFGIHGAEAGFALAGVLTFATVMLIPLVKNKKLPVKPKDFLILDDDFGAKPEELYEASMHDINNVMEVSEEIRHFCIGRGASGNQATLLALFVEEMAANSVEHGYDADRRADVDLRFVFHDGSGVIRLRDDGKLFDPIRWLEKNDGSDPASGLGIRTVVKAAKSVSYMASMEMNNLLIIL